MKLCIVSISIFTLAACNSGGKDETNKGDTAISQSPVQSGKIDIESFGDIRIGQHYKETIKVLGEPDMKAPPIEWEADGLMHEDWNYGSRGLAINMSSEIGKADSTRSIFSITATVPCTYKTKGNIGIGSSYEETKAAYKKDINAEMTTPEQIIVGQIYGGIFFTFDNNGKVNRIFLGSAAE